MAFAVLILNGLQEPMPSEFYLEQRVRTTDPVNLEIGAATSTHCSLFHVQIFSRLQGRLYRPNLALPSDAPF